MIKNLFSRKCPKTTAVWWCGVVVVRCCVCSRVLPGPSNIATHCPGHSSQLCTMSGFSEATLAQKLAELNQTAPSIQGVSLWLLHHRKHYQTYVKVRNEETS